MTALFALILLFQIGTEGAKTNPTDDEQLKIAVAAEAKKFTSACVFSVGNATQLEQFPTPILRWSNPIVGRIFGEVFLWTDHGRPIAIASWFRWFEPNWGRTFEICSLTTQPVKAKANGSTIWDSKKPGITFQSLENVEAAAKSPAHRLAQMRRLAVEFVANLDDTRTDLSVDRQLRLLPQPIYRYPSEVLDLVDGAIFAFVEGTDPEAILLLEATKDGKWRVAIARMNRDAMRVTFRKEVIWTAARIDDSLKLPTEPYCLVNTDALPK